jgi:hypothetical protein
MWEKDGARPGLTLSISYGGSSKRTLTLLTNLNMHDRLRLTQAKMPDEVQLELLAPWYTQEHR